MHISKLNDPNFQWHHPTSDYNFAGGQVEIRDKWCKEFYDDNEKLDTLEFAGMVLLQVRAIIRKHVQLRCKLLM